MKVLTWILGLAVGAMVLLFMGGTFLKPSHISGYTQIDGQWVTADPVVRKDEARKKIEICWSDQAKKSLEPSTARYVASMCEKWEDKFMQDYQEKP